MMWSPVLPLLPSPDVTHLGVVCVLIHKFRHLAIVLDLGFKGFDETINNLVRECVIGQLNVSW